MDLDVKQIIEIICAIDRRIEKMHEDGVSPAMCVDIKRRLAVLLGAKIEGYNS